MRALMLLFLLVPPLPDGTLLTELANPLRRADVLAGADAADVARVQAAFFAGSWDAFETWARLTLAGKLAPARAPATPHGRFWAGVLARPAAERDALLRFLIDGRRLRAGLHDRLGQPPLPPCTPACRDLVTAYLAAFGEPRHAPSEEQLLGPTLVARSHQPDELVVGLAADLDLVAAVPHLERAIAARRRFHQLFTDYGTSPSEVGDLFGAALRALVKLGRAHPEVATRARAFLAAEIARARGDEVWMEETSESPRGGSNAIKSRPVAGAAELSRLPLLTLAGAAIDGDAGALRALGERRPASPAARWPAARWIDRLDVSSAVERRGGSVIVGGGALIALDHTSLTVIDLATGDHRFEHHLGGVAGAGGGLQAWASRLVATPRGLVVPLSVRTLAPPVVESSRLVTFDPVSGEVRAQAAYPPGLPSLLREPDDLAAAGDAVWQRFDRLAFKLGPDGALLDRRTLAAGEELRVAGDRLVRFTTDKLVVERGGKVAFERPAGDLVLDDVLLTTGGVVLVGRSAPTLLALDGAGKQRWRLDLPERWPAPPTPCGGDRLCVRLSKELLVVDAAGKTALRAPLPAGTREQLVSGDTIYFLTADAVVAQRPGAPPRSVVANLTGMAHLVGVSDACLLVTFYESGDRQTQSGWYLGCFPGQVF